MAISRDLTQGHLRSTTTVVAAALPRRGLGPKPEFTDVRNDNDQILLEIRVPRHTQEGGLQPAPERGWLKSSRFGITRTTPYTGATRFFSVPVIQPEPGRGKVCKSFMRSGLGVFLDLTLDPKVSLSSDTQTVRLLLTGNSPHRARP